PQGWGAVADIDEPVSAWARGAVPPDPVFERDFFDPATPNAELAADEVLLVEPAASDAAVREAAESVIPEDTEGEAAPTSDETVVAVAVAPQETHSEEESGAAWRGWTSDREVAEEPAASATEADLEAPTSARPRMTLFAEESAAEESAAEESAAEE